MKNKLTLQLKKAFTLVELIVVVTILAIIGTIGFVSYTDYLSGVRDTNRTVQLESIGDGLKLSLTKGRLPIPDDYIEVKTNGDTIAYQGYAGEEVLKKIKYDKEGKEPLDNTYFSYYATDNRKNFQLMALLEETNETVSLYNRREVLSNDIDYADRQVKVSGKKLGILTGGGDNLNVPVQEIGEIKDNGELDITTTGEEYISHIDDNDKISGDGSELIKSIYNSSCKRILESSLDNGDGVYKINPAGTEEFEVYCDMITDGGGWTRFWWYTGNSWPVGEIDVLKYDLSDTNVNLNFGFSRIPSNVNPENLFIKSGHKLKLNEKIDLIWKFDQNNTTSNNILGVLRDKISGSSAGAVWNPINDTNYKCGGGCDYFWYQDKYGIYSFNFDDDGGGCNTAFGAGNDSWVNSTYNLGVSSGESSSLPYGCNWNTSFTEESHRNLEGSFLEMYFR